MAQSCKGVTPMTSPSPAHTPGDRPPTLHQMARAAWADETVRAQAIEALELFRSYCSQPQPRIPGCDTVIRVAIRIHCGMTVEEAAAREYCYRWHLCLNRIINHLESRSSAVMIHAHMCYPAPHQMGQ